MSALKVLEAKGAWGSDIVDSNTGAVYPYPTSAEPRPPGPPFPATGPVPPLPPDFHHSPNEPDRSALFWALAGAAIVAVGLGVWAVGSLFSSSESDITSNGGDTAAPGEIIDSPGLQTDATVVPFSADETTSTSEAEQRAVLSVTTTTAETTSTTTTTTEPTTTLPPTTEAPTTTEATTTAPPPTEALTSEATTTTTEATTTAPPAPPGNDSAIQQEVLAFTNQARADNGCPALSLNDKLNVAADRHSEDMAVRGYFDHTSPEGEGPGVRVADAGYSGRGWGENIAQGYGSAAAVVEGWMNSPGHRANILNCEFSELGVGYGEGATRGNVPGIYWTQMFGIS